MKKKIFTLILFLAVFLRFFQLGNIPIGLSWDEAAIGYNGFGIATVHRDEWLVKMPVTFKSFGDFKAALAIYADALSTTVFGRNVFAVRFPMAVAGVMTVVAVYFIAKKLFSSEREAFIAMFLVAVSPLNVHFSRIAFESGIAISLTAFGIMFFLYAPKKSWFYILSAVSFVLSLYAYHSTKIAVPLFLLLLAVKERKEWTKHLKIVVLAIVIGTTLVFPLVKETLQGNAGERFYMTSVIADRHGLKPLPYVFQIVFHNYLLHLDPRFLLLGETQNYRHGNGVFGVLGYTEFALVIAGLVAMTNKTWRKKYGWIILGVLIGILPAAISNDVPHSNRAHGMIPWIQLFSVVGFSYILSKIPKRKKDTATIVFILLTLIQTVWYACTYTKVYTSVAAARDFQYGYKEVIAYARSQESSVHSILMTSGYGQPYIYILFYKGLTPIQWQQGALSNYELRDFTWADVKDKKNILIIGTPKEIPADAPGIVKEIFFPDGSVAYRIVKTP